LGQYLLGRVGGATAVSPKTRFGGGAHPRAIGQGDIVELISDKKRRDLPGAVDSLVGQLHARGLEAVPVAVLVRGA
jgi:hypothetical protein